jgi:predicted hotdog family 3-hydroxylacyl-ACP dehydratase
MNNTLESQKQTILESSVESLIPHSQPMVLLDRLIDFSDKALTAEVGINEHSRFFNPDKKGVETWVSIEYMAQAIAALAGIRSRLKHQPVKLGFLLGTRKMQIYQALLKPSLTYTIVIKELYMDDSGLGAFQCAIKHGDIIISEAKLNVFETNDENQLIN